MYFIKYQPLKSKLSERSLTDREALPYLLIFTVLTVIGTSLPLYDDFNKWDALSSLLSALLIIAGVIYAYIQNGGEKGYDFIQKYVVLGWVVFVRCFFVLLAVAIPFFIILGFLGVDIPEESNVYDVLFLFLWEAFFYQRIGRHIKDTNIINRSEPGAKH